ncbi:putative Transcriptional Regulator, LysR family; Glycine cleavage system transcriptional activator (Gcv operon activator) [Mesorhizobium sp. SOD10]|nr:putative Transcriptional Regulator, LysR family; Glycine cleavage system transcriptional activator (Gcv operon activator) [Mesorhizobium sp. SOD10]
MGFRLPPMNTLRLFEAAARLGSFKQAAEEVHVTPSAVSHGLRTLEHWLGAELFLRDARGLTLTPAGETYASEVHHALKILASATEGFPGRRKATGALSVSVAPTFANRWLLPRLPKFTERYPDISITIDTARRHVDFLTDGFDLAIRMATSSRSSESWTELVAETFVPVCSPELLRKHAPNDEIRLIERVPTIHVTAASEDWAAWFRAKDMTAVTGSRRINVDTIQLAAEAAIQGLGIAMGRKPLMNGYIDAGDLIEIAGPPVPVATRYWLVGSHKSFDRPEIKSFRNWILQELKSRSSPQAPSHSHDARISMSGLPNLGLVAQGQE